MGWVWKIQRDTSYLCSPFQDLDQPRVLYRECMLKCLSDKQLVAVCLQEQCPECAYGSICRRVVKMI